MTDERLRLHPTADRYSIARFLTTDERARKIDESPGITEAELGLLATEDLPEPRRLKALGYRCLLGPDSCLHWWPSQKRCAQLAQTATGDRRETLLRGMLL